MLPCKWMVWKSDSEWIMIQALCVFYKWKRWTSVQVRIYIQRESQSYWVAGTLKQGGDFLLSLFRDHFAITPWLWYISAFFTLGHWDFFPLGQYCSMLYSYSLRTLKPCSTTFLISFWAYVWPELQHTELETQILQIFLFGHIKSLHGACVSSLSKVLVLYDFSISFADIVKALTSSLYSSDSKNSECLALDTSGSEYFMRMPFCVQDKVKVAISRVEWRKRNGWV
jgi:hypothetical protein